MNRKPLIAIVAVVIGLFLVAYFGTPFLAVRGLIAAARAGDEAALEQRVDFPALRQSMKNEMNARLVAEMRKDLGDKGAALGGLGMLLAPGFISSAVDALITPKAVAAMVTEAREPRASDAVGQTTPKPESTSDRIKRSYGFRDLDTFVVTLTDARHPDRRLDLLLERRAVFSWKLAGVDLPDPK
ncbi:DUF2939 domain-containing protein [soil metagenome]